MKLKILIISLLVIASLKNFAQDISYYYDTAGNRTDRVIVLEKTTQSESTVDTTSVNTETEGKEAEPEIYEDQLAEKQLKIYPNPTYGKLTVEIVNYNLTDNGNIRVFDMSGRLVQKISSLSESMEIDISSEPAGTYIMVMLIGNEKTEWKIIKQ